MWGNGEAICGVNWINSNAKWREGEGRRSGFS